MKLIPFGGKTPNNTAAAVSVDANGKLDTVKTWGVDVQTVTKQLRSTSGGSTLATEINCDGYAMVSLRILNLHKDADGNKLPIHVQFQTDRNASSTELLKGLDGEYPGFYVPYGESIVTPEDFPPLKYLTRLKFYCKSETAAPTTGDMTFYVYKKR